MCSTPAARGRISTLYLREAGGVRVRAGSDSADVTQLDLLIGYLEAWARQLDSDTEKVDVYRKQLSSHLDRVGDALLRVHEGRA